MSLSGGDRPLFEDIVGAARFVVPTTRDDPVEVFEWSGCGTSLAAAVGKEPSIFRLNPETLELKHQYRLRSHKQALSCMAWSPGGSRQLLATGDKSGVVWLCDMETFAFVGKAGLTAGADEVTAIAVSPKAMHVIVANKRAQVAILDFEKRVVMKKVQWASMPRDLAWAWPDQVLLATGRQGDVDQGFLEVCSIHEAPAASPSSSSSSSSAAAAQAPTLVTLRRQSSVAVHAGEALGLSVNASGTLAATAGSDGVAAITDLGEMACVAAHDRAPMGVLSVSLSPCGRLLAYTAKECDAEVVRAADGALVRSVPYTSGSRCIRFHPGGRGLAVSATGVHVAGPGLESAAGARGITPAAGSESGGPGPAGLGSRFDRVGAASAGEPGPPRKGELLWMPLPDVPQTKLRGAARPSSLGSGAMHGAAEDLALAPPEAATGEVVAGGEALGGKGSGGAAGLVGGGGMGSSGRAGDGASGARGGRWGAVATGGGSGAGGGQVGMSDGAGPASSIPSASASSGSRWAGDRGGGGYSRGGGQYAGSSGGQYAGSQYAGSRGAGGGPYGGGRGLGASGGSGPYGGDRWGGRGR